MNVAFHEIEPLKYKAIRARIRAQADSMREIGNAGSAISNGVEVSWSYDESTRVLRFNCLARPWYVPESLIASRIRGLMESL
jgi:hypothetical protein